MYHANCDTPKLKKWYKIKYIMGYPYMIWCKTTQSEQEMVS